VKCRKCAENIIEVHRVERYIEHAEISELAKAVCKIKRDIDKLFAQLESRKHATRTPSSRNKRY
jgi:predicted RecB family endonuclease